MQHIKPAFFVQGFVYSFAKDGGALGSINTGIIIPNGALVVISTVQNITTCVGAGSSFDVGILGATTRYGSYGNAMYGTSRHIFTGAATILAIGTGDPILLTISGGVVTDGKFKCCLFYFNSSAND